MQTTLSEQAKRLPRAAEAESILRTCVHCGFCNATCPTYQLQGDELDGPRGRIYLIKQVLEGHPATAQTQLHLDRCLSCRACETTCPSGVDYHNLLDIGRAVVDQAVPRSADQRLLRQGLRAMAPNPGLFKALLQIGATLPTADAARPRSQIAARRAASGRMANHRACAKSADARRLCATGLSPNTNTAAARVLDRLGISVIPVTQAGCCGALDYHLDAQEQGLNRARQNIDAWWPALENGAEAIVQTASGCGAFIKDYGHLLKDDPAYAAKATRVSAMSKDLVEILRDEPLERVWRPAERRIAFHCPCTLQHALKLGGAVEERVDPTRLQSHRVPDAHLCCGSAGTYSLTQPELSRQLRDNKMNALESGKPQVIVTANIGCQSHLASAGRTPVRHWIELVEDALH